MTLKELCVSRRTSGIVGLYFEADSIKSVKFDHSKKSFDIKYLTTILDPSESNFIKDNDDNSIRQKSSNGSCVMELDLSTKNLVEKTKRSSGKDIDILYCQRSTTDERLIPIVQLHSTYSNKIVSVELLTGNSIVYREGIDMKEQFKDKDEVKDEALKMKKQGKTTKGIEDFVHSTLKDSDDIDWGDVIC